MSVENPENTAEAQIDAKPLNGNSEVNGIKNGHVEKKEHSSSRHKSSNKDRHRDKDRGDHKSSKSSHRDRDSDKHKSSSSSKDKHRDKDRKDRDKDKERSKDNERDKDKHHKSSSSSHKSSRDKDKERNREKDKDRNRDKDKERDHEKERKREHKSSNDKDRHKTSSSSTKHSTSSISKDKNRDKDRHHSSSSKDKDRHRGKDRHRSDKTSKSSSSIVLNGNNVVEVPNAIVNLAEQPRNDYDQSCTGFDSKENDFKVPIKEEQQQHFNISQASSCDYSMSQFRKDEPDFSLKTESFEDENPDLTIDESENIENKHEIKMEEEDDDDVENIPLAKRKHMITGECDSEDDIPLISRKKFKSEKKDKTEKKKKRKIKEDDFDDEYAEVEKPKKKKIKNEKTQVNQSMTTTTTSTTKKKKKEPEEEQEVWRWWEEEKKQDGVKWNFLEHKGPVFAPLYDPLPKNIHFFYDGKEIHLSEDAEEAATFYAKMLNHDYVTKKQFNDNFFKDWRKTMTSREKDMIKDLSKCNFNEMHQFFNAQSEQRKSATKEEKLVIKKQNEDLIKEYGFCTIDGHKEKIGNFKLEPPGLFRGRGEHPKMGMIKRRIQPEDVSINCAKNSKIPQPPKGHRWKEVRHDNTVTWLASWIENVQGQGKYIMLNPSSKLKGEKDFMKYETARRLDKHIEKIRATYRDEWKSKEMRVRQRAVALYFIDKLALRAGNEKDEDQADTVGCCSLRVEHVSLHKEMNGKENVVVFDFLGKDSIRYYNEVEVEKRVFKNLELFMDNKKEGDDLFDRLNTQVLNEHLKELMDGLTAKVFRTYNASITLQNQLDLLTDANATVPEKLLAYNRANRAVAVLCNHQRSVPKSHDKSMENLKEKIRQKREALDDCESELYDLKKAAKRGSAREKILCDKKQKQFDRLKEQLKKLELQETDRDENKTIALGTSKLNYLDPRISVAWCKKYNVPIEKIFNKTHRDKFRWAIHMADENYRF